MLSLKWQRRRWHFFSGLYAFSLAGNLSMVTRWAAGEPGPAPIVSALLSLLLLASAPHQFTSYPQPEEEVQP